MPVDLPGNEFQYMGLDFVEEALRDPGEFPGSCDPESFVPDGFSVK
jgi:hypothetical protein